ncbi:magnesium transporter MgtE N-terminal domain-containing protein [Parahaliea aestuarii]|uniref:Magnesium transporter MgtE intracellular domain-containing protein n=1 Tax=Parahaliea aestuarii TaxID=1852021 RepID=A0A5C9A1D8_9GAMM|nr:hypothetical protein [Parahaliea aestuarii]TXS94675.1 hypothetical protein FVW59_01825 [Parahaliea aestuarii]
MSLDPLVLAFATSRPRELAVQLADRELAELEAFIAQLPRGTAAALASHLPSWQLTGLMETLPPAQVAALLADASADEAVALAAHLHESRYETVLQAAPEEERGTLYQLLQFPSHTLAALVSSDFIRVADDTLCQEFCEELSGSTDTRAQPVLVVGPQGHYRGLLNLRAAFARKNRGRTVGQVVDNVEPLSGLTDAATALGSRQWADHADLPVVDHQQRVLGVISRAALERVAGETRPGEFGIEKVLTELASGYLNTCGRVMESLLGRP